MHCRHRTEIAKCNQINLHTLILTGFVSRLIFRPVRKRNDTQTHTHTHNLRSGRTRMTWCVLFFSISQFLFFFFGLFLHRYVHVIVITSDDILLSFAVDGLRSNSWWRAKKVKVYLFDLSVDCLYIAFVPHAHPTECKTHIYIYRRFVYLYSFMVFAFISYSMIITFESKRTETILTSHCNYLFDSSEVFVRDFFSLAWRIYFHHRYLIVLMSMALKLCCRHLWTYINEMWSQCEVHEFSNIRSQHQLQSFKVNSFRLH